MAGSSPHTRGARVGGCGDGLGCRIIPAYAGSTSGSMIGTRRSTDHPRIRGEHGMRLNLDGSVSGSSPHTRGALAAAAAGAGASGIIPAYAGSTPGAVGTDTAHWDHPRIRGEHPGALRASSQGPGSSPHTRGARAVVECEGSAPGIIPAYAGSTGCG